MTSRFVLTLAISITAMCAAHAEVRELSKVDWWAAHGGVGADGQMICALVTAATNVPGAQLVIEYRAGHKGLLLRLVKPTWRLAPRTQRPIDVSIGYGEPVRLGMIGSGSELNIALPSPEARAFVDQIRNRGFSIGFPQGSEPVWSIARGGEGFVEQDWLKCIAMSIARPDQPATQP